MSDKPPRIGAAKLARIIAGREDTIEAEAVPEAERGAAEPELRPRLTDADRMIVTRAVDYLAAKLWLIVQESGRTQMEISQLSGVSARTLRYALRGHNSTIGTYAAILHRLGYRLTIKPLRHYGPPPEKVHPDAEPALDVTTRRLNPDRPGAGARSARADPQDDRAVD